MKHPDNAYAAVLYDALRPDPFYRNLEAAHPDPAASRDAMLRYYALSIQEAAEFGRLAESSEEASGISVWSLPLPEDRQVAKSQAKQRAITEAMGRECAALYTQIAMHMAEREKALGLGAHWYLSILGVAPERQGQGLGRALLLPVLEDADRAQVGTYLTTFTPRNIPFYQRLGYRAAGSFPEPATGAAYHILSRPPGGA